MTDPLFILAAMAMSLGLLAAYRRERKLERTREQFTGLALRRLEGREE